MLFVAQYVGGSIMIAIGFKSNFSGIGPNGCYNRHKSQGLLAQVIAVFCTLNHHAGQLPPWVAGQSLRERGFIHWNERLLYAAMFVMPVSCWLYVMFGHYGVNLFGLWEMLRPLPRDNMQRDVFRWVHILSGWVLAASLVGHIALVLWHTAVKKDGMLARMLARQD